jgi:hypothetical protein
MLRILFLFGATIPLLSGCELLSCSGPDYLNFALVRNGGNYSTAPQWGANETMTPTDEIQILFEEDKSLPADVLELFASDGAPVALASVDMFVPTDGEGCAHDERHYALDSLAIGDYTLVHRRENGTGDPLNCLDPDCPWTTFDGSQAVTLTLSIR